MKIVDRILLASEKSSYDKILNRYKFSSRLAKVSRISRDATRLGLELSERELLAEKIVKEPARNALSSFLLVKGYKNRRWLENNTKKTVSIKRFLVIGAGTMGKGISYLISSCLRDVSVAIREKDKIKLRNAKKDIERTYKDAVKRGFFYPDEARAGLNRISFSDRALGDKDLVVESVTEDSSIKKAVFKSIEKELSGDSIVATNTSCISIRELSESFECPERFLGVHFFNPAYKMKLVEVVPSEKTSKDVLMTVLGFLRGLKRVPIVVKDSPGFLVNRMLLPYLNEAVFMLNEGFRRDAIEDAMLKFGMPIGPIGLIENIGPDVAYKAAKILEDNFGTRMKVPGRLKKRYDKGKRYCSQYEDIVERLLKPMRREARLCLEEGIVESHEAIDLALLLGVGFPNCKRIWKN
ncbi:3-hydroxyacyl-CoA dehydrogenase NAD-binding domain-containing protein [Candidatus Omnitrophota bacterium]